MQWQRDEEEREGKRRERRRWPASFEVWRPWLMLVGALALGMCVGAGGIPGGVTVEWLRILEALIHGR